MLVSGYAKGQHAIQVSRNAKILSRMVIRSASSFAKLGGARGAALSVLGQAGPLDLNPCCPVAHRRDRPSH